MEGTRERKLFLLFLLVAVVSVVVLWGRMEFHNELEREVLPHVFLGYLDGTSYDGTVDVDVSWLSAELAAIAAVEPQTLSFTQPGRIGVFADLVYYENRLEQRAWFSGKLLQRESEYYYKVDGYLRLEAIYEALKPAVAIQDIKPQGYDYTSFRGTK